MVRLGHYAFRWRRGIIAVYAVVAIVAAVAGASVFNAVKPFGFQDPDSESARAEDRVEGTTGVEPVPGVIAIVDSASASRVNEVAESIRSVPRVARVVTGLDPRVVGGISEDGNSTLVLGYLASGTEDEPAVGADALSAAYAPDVQLGGSAVAAEQINSRSETDLRRAELIALPILFLLSLWVFRGLVAALFPIVVGGISIAGALAIMRALGEIVDIDVFAINLVTALGLGLSIDYCLFVVSRYREELAALGPGSKPIVRTMQTAGRTVAFSSLTIAGALVALLVFPQRFLYSMGIGGPVVALLSGLIVLTAVPAMLSILGPRINDLAPASLQRRRSKGGAWYRVARFVMRRPLPIATVTAAVMIVCGLPFLKVELTLADARTLPDDTSAHQVDATVRSEFSADPGAAMVVLVESRKGTRAQLGVATSRLAANRAVGEATRPARLGDGLTRVEFTLLADPNSDAAVEVVETARKADWGGSALVSGRTAELVDQRESIREHVPLALSIIAGLTLVLLFVMTRCLLLPVLALVVNLLTVGVALGAMVFVFQDGRFENLLDFASVGAIDRSVPILLFAIVFGLSTDYGIFFITRIQEARQEGESDSESVALGIERSGRILTAGALLLSVAIGAVAFSDLIYNKELAIGAAIGVLVDATLVRAFLFPSLLRLGGRWTWWAPAWLSASRGAGPSPPPDSSARV